MTRSIDSGGIWWGLSQGDVRIPQWLEISGATDAHMHPENKTLVEGQAGLGPRRIIVVPYMTLWGKLKIMLCHLLPMVSYLDMLTFHFFCYRTYRGLALIFTNLIKVLCALQMWL